MKGKLVLLAALLVTQAPHSPHRKPTTRRPTPPRKPQTPRPASCATSGPPRHRLGRRQKAGDAGDFDKAVEAAKEAEALAKASIYQATSEKTLWKEMEIR
jgi:hypothetical protein